MANEIKKGIDEATFHPSLITGETTTGIAITPLYDGTSASFKGFNFVATQQTAKTSRAEADITWTDISKNNGYTDFTTTNGSITGTSRQGFYVQNREYPISQNAGTCLMNFSEANTGNWMVGLSRINTQRNLGAAGYDYSPSYMMDTSTASILNPVFIRGQYRYADVCVLRFADELRVYQSGARTLGSADGIYMNEVTYYGNHNTNFNTVYNIGTNTAKYRKVRFELENEEISIFLVNEAGASTLLCDFTILRAAGAIKNECLNPTNAAKWAMYPVCAGGNRTSAAYTNQTIVLESIDHYTSYPKFDESKYFNYDWWGWSHQYGETVFCNKLERRNWNSFSSKVKDHGVGANGLLAPKGLNASGGMDDYDSILITARSDVYGTSTNECNTQFTLGFSGDPISRPTSSTNLATTTESTSTPQLVSNILLFVRLNNFTQNSVNARQGTTSKIVAHLPRFE